jgi:hypothetical protein
MASDFKFTWQFFSKRSIGEKCIFFHFRRLEQISFIGQYLNGRPTGKAWIGLIGNGWIFGDVDDSGKISDDQGPML